MPAIPNWTRQTTPVSVLSYFVISQDYIYQNTIVLVLYLTTMARYIVYSSSGATVLPATELLFYERPVTAEITNIDKGIFVFSSHKLCLRYPIGRNNRAPHKSKGENNYV